MYIKHFIRYWFIVDTVQLILELVSGGTYVKPYEEIQRMQFLDFIPRGQNSDLINVLERRHARKAMKPASAIACSKSLTFKVICVYTDVTDNVRSLA